jgi:pyruvate,water dikinase
MGHTRMRSEFIRWFEDISLGDVPLVGGKTASLGEMTRSLGERGISVPRGFGVTVSGYWLFLHETGLRQVIANELSGLVKDDPRSLQLVGSRIRAAILRQEIPQILTDQICEAYRELEQWYESQKPKVPEESQSGQLQSERILSVAVRSSATAEDLPDASFAGQQETYLNVRGEAQLINACKKCYASLFTDRAISYRNHKNFNHFDVALSLCVQEMVRSDQAVSGVMFSIDTESGFKDAVLINASYGLGESIVQGAVNPDEFTVFKPTLMQGKRPLLQKQIGSKESRMVYDSGGSRGTRTLPVSPEERRRFCISDDEVLQLARWACIIEEHYSQRRGIHTPMDIEWGKDGPNGGLYILQARPETVKSRAQVTDMVLYRLPSSVKEQSGVILTGRSVGEKIASGMVRNIPDVARLSELREGEILVTDRTDPDWEPMMKRAAAIVTNRGGRTCHAAIVSRELGLPAIVGTGNGTEVLRTGMRVTVSCAEGEVGRVYTGELPFEVEHLNLTELNTSFATASGRRTQLMLNLAQPEEAFHLSMLPNDGIGLARMEFIINHLVRIHPMALLRFDEVTDVVARGEIARLTRGYSRKADYFVDHLSQGIAMLAAAFYPKDVILRMSDFKTNEYANLIGGKDFEPHEENPMIGFRGASRYYSPQYREGFALECEAVLKVREDMGLTNLKVMIPFCRTPEEGLKVLDEMRRNGLERGKNGLEVYVMCEIPSNVVLADQFAEIFDGFSIGSNDLTQLMLGVDRDSEILSSLFDERHAAVTRTLEAVIRDVRARNKKIGICGQAPSDYPEFAEFLVRCGIDSISLNPDTLLKTTQSVRRLEREISSQQAAAG